MISTTSPAAASRPWQAVASQVAAAMPSPTASLSFALHGCMFPALQEWCACTQHQRHKLLRIPVLNVATLRSDSCFAVLERLTLDGTGADDEALPLLAPLAGTLKFISVCPSSDLDFYKNISLEGVQVAMETFARCGGRPEIQCDL
jgi:hypothetical protein